jgi:hypothetical protein
LIAYDSVVDRVGQSATSLSLIALEVHLKTILRFIFIVSIRPISCSLINSSTFKVLNPPQLPINGVHVKKNDQPSAMIDSPQASTPSHPFQSNGEIDCGSSQNVHPNLPKTAYRSSSSLRLIDLKTHHPSIKSSHIKLHCIKHINIPPRQPFTTTSLSTLDSSN